MKSFFIPRFLALLVVWTLVSATAFAKMNKAFVENIGQITDQHQNKRTDIVAKYQAGNGLSIFLSKTGIHYQWSKEDEMYRMDVKLLNANTNPRITKKQTTGFKEQYQHALVKGIAQSFEKITYHDIYPSIDWTFYFNEEGKLEHDFIIRAGGKVSDIRLQYAGADDLKIDRFGNLIATTNYGGITEPAPYSYEETSNKKINSSYLLNGNMLTFKTSAYTGTLVIDPVIDWATYFGGSEYDEIRDVKIGKDGFVYAVGATNSTTNIATTGAHLTTFAGGNNSIGADAFIAKFDTDGNCIWATYFGGATVDLGLALTVDTAGKLYMAGRTNSPSGIATTGSHQATKSGTSSGYDVFLVKMDTSGTPIWSTYYGGTGADGTEAVALSADRYGHIYLSGNTQSAGGIATTGTFQSTRPGNQDGFVAKFNVAGNLIWGTYCGTAMNDWINGMTTDTAGNIVVVGQTLSTTGLSSSGAHLATGNGGTDGFIAKFDSAGQRLWSTYYGGADNDRLFTVTTDSLNAVYFAGVTNSSADIATLNAHQSSFGGSVDACIGKFTISGALQWSTYYGGNENESIQSLECFQDKLFAGGWSNSPSNIATTDGINPIFNNSVSEGFLTTFDTSGQRLWSTYLGGDFSDDIRCMVINDQEQVFLGGKTASINGLSTAGAHQTTFEGNQDGMLLRINMCDVPVSPAAISGNGTVCENSTQQYTVPSVADADTYVWIIPNGWTGNSNTDTIDLTVGADNGTIKAVAVNSCGSSDTVSMTVIVNPAPQPTISRSGNILSVSQTFSSYQWMLNGDPVSGATNPTHIVTQNGTYTLLVEGTNSCSGISNDILIDNLTSIDNVLNALGIQLYPNPVITELIISAPFEMEIKLIDVLGRSVKTITVSQGTNQIDCSVLPDGSYWLNCYDKADGQLLGTEKLVRITN